eukprot:561068-Pyramimonas_sp.AAC.1
MLYSRASGRGAVSSVARPGPPGPTSGSSCGMLPRAEEASSSSALVRPKRTPTDLMYVRASFPPALGLMVMPSRPP